MKLLIFIFSFLLLSCSERPVEKTYYKLVGHEVFPEGRHKKVIDDLDDLLGQEFALEFFDDKIKFSDPKIDKDAIFFNKKRSFEYSGKRQETDYYIINSKLQFKHTNLPIISEVVDYSECVIVWQLAEKNRFSLVPIPDNEIAPDSVKYKLQKVE